MKLVLLCVPAVLLMLVFYASNARTEDIRYIGKYNGQDAAVVISGQENQVSVGTAIPGCGTVVQITDTHLIVEHRLSDSEKADLKRQGAEVYGTIEIRIPREDLRLVIGPYGNNPGANHRK